jgi:GNAT superfamily N-acetyltransferase
MAGKPWKTAGSKIIVVPANKASCMDLQVVFGARGEAAKCQCQRFKTPATTWDREKASGSVGARAERLREQTHCGRHESHATSGLVAYMDGEPVGWCAVELRTAYIRLQKKPLVWAGRVEDKADDSVWAVTCLITRAGFRKRGVTYALARAAVDFAREHGARAIEGYPMITKAGEEITWGELHVGNRKVFASAGFKEVSKPTPRRIVMRINF